MYTETKGKAAYKEEQFAEHTLTVKCVLNRIVSSQMMI